MKLVSRYFLGRFLGYFLVILTLLMLVILVADLLLNLDNILDQTEGSLGALALALALRTPARYLPVLVPLACFAGAFMAVGLAARWHEITALKAGGVSPLRVAIPLLGAALLLSGVALVLDETVVVQAARALHGGSADAEPVAFRRGSFWYQRGRSIYNIRQADSDAGTLEGVSVYDLDEHGRLVRSLRAPRGRVDAAGHWVLQDAVVLSFDPDHPAAAPRVERLAETTLVVQGESELALLDANAATLTLEDLREYIQARIRDGADVTRLRALLHERLSDPLSVLLFALLALPLALRVEDTKSLAAPALQGIGLVALFFVLRNLGSTLADQGVAPPAVPSWLVLCAFLVFGFWRLSRVPR